MAQMRGVGAVRGTGGAASERGHAVGATARGRNLSARSMMIASGGTV